MDKNKLLKTGGYDKHSKHQEKSKRVDKNMTTKDSVRNKDFFEFVKAIGESKSKQEEDRIITDEVTSLKRKMSESNVTWKKPREFLLRLLYVEMLGLDASFALWMIK